ncbi:Sporulation protein RMD1 [Glycine soja]|uniref:Sporulation protein RMD1 n=1 Tax=Glycine soja TaxID=3848 RepID=A0A0B2PBW6_GLYSO|nr:Sporulation protein RMD1 [Glycine soja]
MWRTTLDSSTMRALRLRSFLFSSSSSSSSSCCSLINIFCPSSSSSSFTTLTTIISHSFLPFPPTTRVLFTDSRRFGSPVPRCVSSLPTLDWNDAVSCSEVEVDANDDGAVDQDTKPSIAVRAFFFSTSVDLKSLVEQNKANFVPPSSRMTNYVVLKFGDICVSKGPGTFLSGRNGCYMVVFQYGSIVLFNVPEHEVDAYLKIVKKHASGLLPEMRKDEYEVREKPALSTWMQGGLDYIMLQYLNIDGIRTIGSVLGQSIALDYYGRQVDGMVAEFTDINREMEATGKFKMQRKKLFQLVGKANSNLADVILKLGLFERSDIAWKDAKYAQIWEYLRDEFELTQRFASLDFKLKFVEHNIRFLQEILQNRKSDFLEWLIIALIGAEILLSLYDIVHRSAMKF